MDGKPSKSLLDWLAQKPKSESPFAVNSVRYMMVLVGIMCLYVTSLLIYHLLLIFEHLGFFSYFRDIIKALAKPKPLDGSQHPLVFLVMLVGFLLYLLKKYLQFYYGLLETIFAMSNCHIIGYEINKRLLEGSDITYTTSISVMASIYLLVRGLSNLSDGWRKEFYLKSSMGLVKIIMDPKTIDRTI